MPFYLLQAVYSPAATASLVEHPQHREEVLRNACAALGGKMHHFFYCFGEYDAMVVAELPSNKEAAALALSAQGSGSLQHHKTTVLLTVDEAIDAMKAAQRDKYVPPR